VSRRARNAKFQWLLQEPKDERGLPRWTVSRMAEAIYCNRSHVGDVLNNKPGHGAQTRGKLIKFFRKEFPKRWPEILESLGWGEGGQSGRGGRDSGGNAGRVAFHVEHGGEP
jgi:hypothetical protein